MVTWKLSLISPTSTVPPRVCAVSFLNTAPLVWGLLHGPQQGRVDLSFDIPSRCADRLAEGSADVGLVPVMELLRQPLTVIPGVGIACRGPVRSILLLSQVPLEEMETLAADSSSRTSVILAQIILEKRYGVRPRVLSHPPDIKHMLAAADAALLIGDPALRVEPADWPSTRCLDLGREWAALTGLPMVFALWAARSGVETEPLAGLFYESWRFGMANLDSIVQQQAPPRAIPAELAYHYLAGHVVFPIGSLEREGLNRFLEWAHPYI